MRTPAKRTTTTRRRVKKVTENLDLDLDMKVKRGHKAVILPTDLVNEITKISGERGVSVAKFIETSVAKIKPIKKILDIGDVVGFGRYSHLTIEQVIRCDESYADWLLHKCENRLFSQNCYDLFEELSDSLR